MENRLPLPYISALNRLYGYTPRQGLALLEKYRDAAAVPGIPVEREITELAGLRQKGVRLLSCLDDDYPALLRETPDRPVGLYVTGTSTCSEIFGYRRAVAIVGTRDISSYGTMWCKRIVRALADAAERPVIVSGFAMGTDIIAHTEALQCGLRTIGVMPCGPDAVYPARHREIAAQLIRTPGCALVSDYPPGTPAMANNFIRRNRIIAGLSDAVILIESKRKGGGLITMDFALDYGRVTYALPGRVEDPCSEGCNVLIRRGKAELISDTDSLIESLGLGLLMPEKPADLLALAQQRYGANSLSLRILAHIKRNRGATPEEICRDLNIPYGTAVTETMRLESDGFIGSDLLQRCYIAK